MQQKQSRWQQEGHQVWRKKAQPAVQGKDETAVPCEKGKGKEQEEPAGRLFFALPCAEGQNPKYAVAVEWYNTLNIKDHVPQENLDSLWKLNDEGYEVHLLSFCGYNRSLEVKQKAWGLGFPFESINFTQDKAGWYGKGQWLQHKKIRVLFDDSKEVIDDLAKFWIRSDHFYPIFLACIMQYHRY